MKRYICGADANERSTLCICSASKIGVVYFDPCTRRSDCIAWLSLMHMLTQLFSIADRFGTSVLLISLRRGTNKFKVREFWRGGMRPPAPVRASLAGGRLARSAPPRYTAEIAESFSGEACILSSKT